MKTEGRAGLLGTNKVRLTELFSENEAIGPCSRSAPTGVICGPNKALLDLWDTPRAEYVGHSIRQFQQPAGGAACSSVEWEATTHGETLPGDCEDAKLRCRERHSTPTRAHRQPTSLERGARICFFRLRPHALVVRDSDRAQ